MHGLDSIRIDSFREMAPGRHRVEVEAPGRFPGEVPGTARVVTILPGDEPATVSLIRF